MRKPQGQYEIDWSHPLASGMVLAIFDGTEYTNPKWESAGLKNEVVDGRYGINADGTSYNEILIRDELKQSSSFTWHCNFYKYGDSDVRARVFGRTAKNSATAPWLNYDFEINDNSQSNAKINIINSANGLVSVLVSDIEEGDNSLSGVVGAGTLTAYSHGIAVNTPVNISVGEYAADSDIFVGAYSGTAGQNTGSVVLFAGVWQRSLSAIEIQSLNDNPYQILKPVRTVLNNAVYAALFSTGAAPTFQPVWAKNINTLIGKY